VGTGADTGSTLQIASFTTTERDYLTEANGMVVYNETTLQFNFRENGAWKTLTGSTYGEMYVDGNTTETTVTDANTWYEVTTNVVTGEVSGITFDGTDKRLVAPIAGKYLVTYTASSTAETANHTFLHGLGVNGGTPAGKTETERKYSTTDVGVVSGNAILSLSANDEVGFFIYNVGNNGNITVRQLNVIMQLV
jgi:hypothetical protein